MYQLPTSNYLLRNLHISTGRKLPVVPMSHKERVEKELVALGVSSFGLWKFASRYLPQVIHPKEHIEGVVYGYSEGSGAVMLLATDRRIVFLDKKPLFISEDEVTYDVVSGVSFGHAGLASTVTLHTRIKDYTVKTLNKKCALGFIAYIESRCLEHTLREEYYDSRAKKWTL